MSEKINMEFGVDGNHERIKLEQAANARDEPEFEIRKIEEMKFLNLNNVDLHGLSNIFDSYATKKTYAAGFFNLALIATNFTQLKHLINLNNNDLYTTLNMVILTSVCLSLLLQVVVGVVLVFLAKSGEFIEDVQREKLIKNNNAVTLLILTISIINVFINVFLNVS